MRRLTVVLACVILAGCGSSPPSRFFTLDAIAPARPQDLKVVTPIKVDAVHIPPAFDRQSIVRGERQHQLVISSQDRWAADFGEMVRNVLAEDLAKRLPPGTVIAPEMPAPDSAYGLVVEILSFKPDGSGHVGLDADWSLLASSPPQPVLRRSERLSEPAGSTAQDEASAMSTLLGRLADHIAIGLAQANGKVARAP
jgi:uncharacterized lipoprotein YmbA